MKKNKIPAFWKTYLIVTGCVAVLFAALLVLGYFVMMDYDKTQKYPSETAANYAAAINKGDYDILYSDTATAPMTFEADSCKKIIEDKIKGKTVTSSKAYSSDRFAHPTYALKADGETIANVIFRLKSEKSTFGFGKYEFDRVELAMNGKYEVKFLVEEGINLFINGYKVEERWKTENAGEYSFEKTTDLYQNGQSGQKKYDLYDVRGLLAEPKTLAHSSDGKYLSLFYDKELKVWRCEENSATVVAPSTSKVYIDGILLNGQDKWIKEKNVADPALSEVAKYTKSDLLKTSYYVTGLKPDSVITAKNYAGEPVTVSFDESKGCYNVASTVSQEFSDAYGISVSTLMSHAKDYALFVSNDKDRYDSLMYDVMPGSAVYEAFDSFWAVLASHNSYWFEKEKIKDISFYSDDCFSCTTYFVHWIKGFNGNPEATEDYPTDLTFYYVEKDGRWYITDWNINDTEK